MAQTQLPELVFISYPGMGHLLPMIRIAERLITQSSKPLSALILIVQSPIPDAKVNSYIKFLNKSNQPFILQVLPPLDDHKISSQAFAHSATAYMRAYKPTIEQTLRNRYGSSAVLPQRRRLSGLVLDIFCTCLIDIAKELCAPSYVFFSSPASALILAFHMEALQGQREATVKDGGDDDYQFGGSYPHDSDEKSMIMVPGFKNPYPMKYWIRFLLSKDGIKAMISLANSLQRANGVLLNTFIELESSSIDALLSFDVRKLRDSQIPSIYPVGPILTLEGGGIVDDDQKITITDWLDTQPPSSVVFLCFGSEGRFNQDQVKEIAAGLERSGQRFLWSLRLVNPPTRPSTNKSDLPLPTGEEYEEEYFSQVLPEGFLDRTASIGKVIGWAPQVAVLGHKAVGAFISHCGWNSVLESLWFGVPILAWPMFAEQQMNAFMLVKELGLALEVRMDYRFSPSSGTANMVVKAEEMEKAIRKMMEEEEGGKVRQNVKEMSMKAKKTTAESYPGSSNEAMGKFLEDVIVDCT